VEFWINVLNNALIIAIFAVSLNVIMGTAGQLTIAPAGLGGIGGYVAGYLSAIHGWDFLPALLGGTAAGGVVGVCLGFPALRLSVEYLILLTLAFATVIVAVFVAIPALGGSTGLIGVKQIDFFGTLLLDPSQYLPLIAIVAAVCFAFCWRLSSSPYGRVLRGIREDGDATAAVGKNVVSYKISTFAWTAAVMGAGGVLLVYYQQIASSTQFSFSVTTTMVAAVVIGGMGNMLGSFAGALLLSAIGPLLQKTVDIPPEKATLWQMVIYGTLLIVVMRLRPIGLIPEGFTIQKWLPDGLRARLAPQVAVAAAPAASSNGRMNGAHSVSADLPAQAPVLADLPPDPHAGDQPRDQLVIAEGLVKSFGGIRAVQGLDLHLASNKITALVGPNGAGKTTVFNLLTGRIRPDEGTVILRGEEITGMAPHRVAGRGMVRSFQDVRTFTRLSLLDNVVLSVPGHSGERLGGLFLRPRAVRRDERKARAAALECLSFVGLEHRAHEPAGALGYGDQKLLAIARLLATTADILLLDEPAAGIDRSNLEPVLEVIERLRDEGKTICLVEHNLDVVTRLADHVFFMEQGKVTAEGRMEEITEQPRLAEVYFGHV
jgi:branched-chain amino acid transport system permease protein